MELLAPAGTLEAAKSAVRNGADAIYAGGRVLNARRASPGFSGEELRALVAYCHLRNVKVHVTVNILTREDELPQLTALAEEIAASGADAAIVSDLGVARVLRKVCPTLPLHASTQLNVHSVSGVRMMEELGFRRVVLARELSLAKIAEICRSTEMEIEVFAHGALCMCYSGNCYLSAVIGQKSGNRGLCAQPCRLPYEGDRYPLSLKDLCTLKYLPELEKAGVCSLKIEGRLKSPEYVGSVTAAYRKVLDGAPAADREIDRLAKIFSRDGFTSGYLTDDTGPEMFGTKKKTAYADYKNAVRDVKATLTEAYEPKKRAVSFHLAMREGLTRLTVRCGEFTDELEGAPPEHALSRAVNAEDAERAFLKLGGTPFECAGFSAKIANDLYYSAAAFNDLRRRALEAAAAHFAPVPHPFHAGLPPVQPLPAPETPRLEAWFAEPARAPENPDPRLGRIWLNALRTEDCLPFAGREDAGLWFPPVIADRELEKLANRLYTRGFRHALCRNAGHLLLLKEMGYTVHADFSLNTANAQAMEVLRDYAADVTLSFELTLREIRACPKPIPAGIIVYGRLPLMHTRNCIIRNCGPCREGAGMALTDRTGRAFPVFCDYRCGNTLYNCAPLWLTDRARDWREAGIHFARLLFTDENPDEIDSVIGAYTEGGGQRPQQYTRGLYYRGVF